MILQSNIRIVFLQARKCLRMTLSSFELTRFSFIVQDQQYNYLSGRFPNDAQLLAEKTIELVKSSIV